jgi:HlyD family secretion protein
MRKSYGLLAILILPLAFASCAKGEEKLEASGSFEATEVIVSAEASGRIISFDAIEGQALEAGQIVGAIDALQLKLRRSQLLASKSSVESRRSDADLQLAAIRQQIDTARKERLRAQNLIKASAANQKQLDDIEAQIASLEKQEAAQLTTITNANEGVRGESSSLDLQVAQLDDQIAKCSISSPIDGTLLVKYAQRGEYATQGKALFKIADTKHMFLRAYLDAALLSKVRLGGEVEVAADFGDKETRKYPGKVAWISDAAEFTPKTAQTRDERASQVYAMKVAVDNDGYLKIGMYGKARFGE